MMADAKKEGPRFSSTGAVHDYTAIHKWVVDRGDNFYPFPIMKEAPASTATPVASACGRCKSVYEPKLKKQVNECTNKCKTG